MSDTTVPMTAGGRADDPRLAWLAPLRARWEALSTRERSALATAVAVIAAAAVWLLLVQPAWTTLREAPARLDALEADLQRMQRLAGEARELKAATPVPATQAVQALQSATSRLGGNGRIVVQGDRATLTVEGVAGDALRTWLAEVRSAARARTVEARLAQGPSGYSGTVIVAIGASGS